MEKVYNPKSCEDRIYAEWCAKNAFHADVNSEKPSFTVVIPPPNITGQLHMGHALNNTLQDAIIRYKRMCGYNALWVPGTDHASIATEVKIVEKLKGISFDEDVTLETICKSLSETVEEKEVPKEDLKSYLWNKKIRLAIYKMIRYFPKILSGNYKKKAQEQ